MENIDRAQPLGWVGLSLGLKFNARLLWERARPSDVKTPLSTRFPK